MIDETEDASEHYEDWLEKELNALDVDDDDNMRKDVKRFQTTVFTISDEAYYGEGCLGNTTRLVGHCKNNVYRVT